eukprot:TRINITY_DN618_c0_g1_i1.p1 TRINITY_DN618_c0_g1~~TRINITY_DN618_c0_g1_i1.p1  ORF type:complete len:471 (-),score=50.03 TRINITY_DN618_c0_g1_i1:4-1416(-)
MDVIYSFASIVLKLVALIVLLGLLFIIAIVVATNLIYKFLPISPPTKGQLKQDLSECALFKYIPELKGKVAWYKLGEFPTPIHKLEFKNPEIKRDVTIYLKREDLSSSDTYGGNKVRTLEFQLACADALAEKRNKKANIYAIGGAGSNQVVAVAAYCNKLKREGSGAFWVVPEASNLENGLNFASTYSYNSSLLYPIWNAPWKVLPLLYGTLFNGKDIILPPGGANPTGSLGHVGAALELANQIERGEVPEPQRIVLPHGSGCTVAGLMAGISIARKLGIGFKRPLSEFEIASVVIHPGFAKGGGFIPRFQAKKLANDVVNKIHQLGGPDASSILQDIIKNNWKVVASCAGSEYGKISPEGEAARELITNGKLTPSNADMPWIDECFSSKASAHLLSTLKDDSGAQKNIIFWCTKSLLQPVGDSNRLVSKISQHSKTSNEYLNKCGISSEDDVLDDKYVQNYIHQNKKTK